MVLYGRWALRGGEVQTWDILFGVLTPDQWGELLKAPLERAAAKGERDLAQKLVEAGAHGVRHHDTRAPFSVPMALYGRWSLRGAEVQTLDLLFEVLTSEQWAELLKAPLECAAAQGEKRLAGKLLQAGAEIGDALHEAIRGGQGEIVKCLLANGASVLAENTDGDTPLHIAAIHGEAEMLQLLLLTGAATDVLNSLASTPLGLAVVNGDVATALVLLAAGADVSLPYGPDKIPLIDMAAQEGRDDMLTALIEHGADVDGIDKFECTALHYAACFNHVNAVQLLLVKGADIDVFDSKGWTALGLAVVDGHVAATLALLAAGADVSLQYSSDKTPLTHVAAEDGNVEILRALIDHGADVDAVDDHQRTALHHAAKYNKANAIHALVEAGANIAAHDTIGTTPLHEACMFLNHEAVVSLLAHGVNVNAQNDFFETPLMLAAGYVVNVEGTQALREAGKVVDSLLRAGADETIVTSHGNTTAGEIKAFFGENEEAKRLLELLVNAPADRAWRRRGYLVLCRAQPDRVQQSQVVSTHDFDTARRILDCAEMASEDKSGCCETVGGTNVDETDSGVWAVVLAKVLLLQEEGLFRTIVGYL